MNNERVKEQAEVISNIMNTGTFSSYARCRETALQLTREHKTLQQNFTRFCLAWLNTVASDDYRADGRNEDSKKLAIDIAEGYFRYTGNSLNEMNVPFVQKRSPTNDDQKRSYHVYRYNDYSPFISTGVNVHCQ